MITDIKKYPELTLNSSGCFLKAWGSVVQQKLQFKLIGWYNLLIIFLSIDVFQHFR